MTTYELPPEPPIGSRVTDYLGRTWNHPEMNRWSLPGADSGLPWATILIYSPLTLIEPDPWPTHELIVATREGKGRRLMGAYSLTSRDYADITGMRAGEVDDMVTHHREPLTNVVPVTVVPVAALPVLWSALEQWLNGHSDPDAATNKLVGAVVGLREQIDALRLDQ